MLKLSTLLATVCLFSGPVMAADKTGEAAGQGNPPATCDPVTTPSCGDRGTGKITELWLLDVSAGHENFCYTLKTPLKLTDSGKAANRRNKTLLLRDPESLQEKELSWPTEDKPRSLNMTDQKSDRYLLEAGESSVALHKVSDSASSKEFLENGCTAQSEFLLKSK